MSGTITLLDVDNRQHKIRLAGIDAPELGQPFGRASKQHLSELLANREAVAECGKTDRYRREVCRVLVGGAGVARLGALSQAHQHRTEADPAAAALRPHSKKTRTAGLFYWATAFSMGSGPAIFFAFLISDQATAQPIGANRISSSTMVQASERCFSTCIDRQ